MCADEIASFDCHVYLARLSLYTNVSEGEISLNPYSKIGPGKLSYQMQGCEADSDGDFMTTCQLTEALSECSAEVGLLRENQHLFCFL